MKRLRFLSKSRFIMGNTCPTRLYYTGKPEYADQKLEDPFLQALAEGGIQVGELAKLMFPGGTDVETLDIEESLAQTAALMERDEVVIFEGAVRWGDCFLRADVIVKRGQFVELFEVKAKSFDGSVYRETGETPFLTKKGLIRSGWVDKLYDVAFQAFVMRKAYPELTICPHLMLVDKSATAATSGLNQKFLITRNERGRVRVKAGDVTEADLETPLLCVVAVGHEVGLIHAGNDSKDKRPGTFEDHVLRLAAAYAVDEKLSASLGQQCGGCEFNAKPADFAAGLKCGRSECWAEQLGQSVEDVHGQPTILEIWNYRRKPQLLQQGKALLQDVDIEDDIPEPKSSKVTKSGMRTFERQRVQVEKWQAGDMTPEVDSAVLAREMASWEEPFHLIDFETTTAAIPFHAGTRPYEGIAFQFSHHVMTRDGVIHHENEFLHMEQGEFPNFEFVRALRDAVGTKGTIFRYAAHENSFLNFIRTQLLRSEEPDRDELVAFIETIATPTRDSIDTWTPTRQFVDLCDLVKRTYYHPLMKGSNSIKAVLPAILNESRTLQERFSKPVYGTATMRSLNFEDKAWIKLDGDRVKDPYKALPPLFDGVSASDERLLYQSENLADGGAAMMAWARMQFTEMSELERQALKSALLKYCELDTLAMAMLLIVLREAAGTPVAAPERVAGAPRGKAAS